MFNNNFKIDYTGSKFWLIFWLILFFPIGLFLLFADSTFTTNDSIYEFKYPGSKFWIGFWILLFFPIAIVLLFLNGFSYTKISKEDR